MKLEPEDIEQFDTNEIIEELASRVDIKRVIEKWPDYTDFDRVCIDVLEETILKKVQEFEKEDGPNV